MFCLSPSQRECRQSYPWHRIASRLGACPDCYDSVAETLRIALTLISALRTAVVSAPIDDRTLHGVADLAAL